MVPVPNSWRSAGVAQLVEHLICNEVVGGSSPFASSAARRTGRRGDPRAFAPSGPVGTPQALDHVVEGCPSGQREQTVNLPAYAFEGSNPSPSTKRSHAGLRAGIAQRLEHRPSKPRVAGSNPVSRSILRAANPAARPPGSLPPIVRPKRNAPRSSPRTSVGPGSGSFDTSFTADRNRARTAAHPVLLPGHKSRRLAVFGLTPSVLATRFRVSRDTP